MSDRLGDSPGQVLLALASRQPPGNLHRPKYREPITVALLNLPFVSHDRRQSLAEAWNERKPDEYVYRALEWYTERDQDLLLFARLAVTVVPILLLHLGVGVGWTVSFVVASMFVVEWLNRVRVEAERERTKAEAKREYWRREERPRINARKRELQRQMRDRDTEGSGE